VASFASADWCGYVNIQGFDVKGIDRSTMNLLINRIILVVVLFNASTTAALAEKFNGVLAWHNKHTLATPISGVVSQIKVVSGATVNKGDIVVQLDTRLVQANLESAEAELQYGKQYFEEAKRELDRVLEMYERALISGHEREVAKIAFSKAETVLKSAQAKLIKAKLDVEHSVVRANVDGYVLQTYVHDGQVITNQFQIQPLLDMVEVGKMDVIVLLTNAQKKNLTFGKNANVKVGKKSYSAKLYSIAMQPDKTNKDKYVVKLAFSHSDENLHPGQSVKVTFN